jgi:hypothetical protein
MRGGSNRYTRQSSQKNMSILFFMRSTLHNWLLRCAALMIFISGGALARAVVQEIETHFVPIERSNQEPKATALNLEVRQPIPVQLDATGLDVQAVPLEVIQTKSEKIWLEVSSVALVVRAFDAHAPPRDSINQ